VTVTLAVNVALLEGFREDGEAPAAALPGDRPTS
jgi:hypothetical protein